MRKLIALTIMCGMCMGIFATDGQAAIREDKPNSVGGELGGRGLILTINYERYFSQHIGAGAGVMAIGTSEGSVFILPLYLSYLSGDAHNLYLSIGATVLGGGGTVSDYETETYATFAVGYQFQSENGFYVRPLFTYLNITDEETGNTGLIWPGIALGASF